MSLKSWVIDALNGSITEVVDGDLLGPEDESYAAKEQCLYSIFSLATKCTPELPEDRIDMKDVVARLQRIKETFLANTSI
ncbi:hypothetical protein C1H46_022336 [Malus baccata]|uniref:Serine-threonine/tyrosine-protein kinase catalytic domain-containing protein n=1 Tax=Malus baccata TaxID=106549 RepID=A0A540M037_MALBA|nr:hypothetical protein C1H46_022336 [Malus baccata]